MTIDTRDVPTIFHTRLYDGTVVVSHSDDYHNENMFAFAHLTKVRESLYSSKQNRLPVSRVFKLAHPHWDWHKEAGNG